MYRQSRPRQPFAATRAVIGSIVLASAGCQAVASGVPNSPGMPARVDTGKSPASIASYPVAVPAAVAAAALSPADQLRQRLAEKLGAPGPSKGAASPPPVVQIVNRSDPAPARPSARETARESARETARKAAASSALPAAGLATAHRASHAGMPASSSGVPLAGAPIAGGAAALGHPPNWDYHGAGGPESWASLRPDFATCANGSRQSPIDIRDGMRLDLDPIRFDYQPSALRVIDNGHTVQVDVAAGSSIEVSGRRFELLQFHFHRPSEERVDGRRFDMVVHLVHRSAEGGLAMVAVLLNRGAAQPLIQTVWNNLPLEKGMDQPVRNPVDLNALLPERRDYFTYMGSLTTPPCTEGVLWMVMKTPVEVSAEQIGIFSRLYPMNARPVQAAGGRMIKESN